MAGKTLIYVGAESDGLYRKEESDGKWEKLAKGMPPSPQVPQRRQDGLRGHTTRRLPVQEFRRQL